MKVLFVHASDPRSEVNLRNRPLWPAYLAAYAEQCGCGDVEFRYVDVRQAERAVFEFQPDFVGIGSVSQDWERAKNLARMFKRYELPVVVGGTHVTAIPESMNTGMTVAVIGEGEQTFVELLQVFAQHRRFCRTALSKVQGIAYWTKDRQLVVNPQRPILDLATVSHPKRSLTGYEKHPYMFTSRGCPYHCRFCASTVYWPKFRAHPDEYVVDEIQELVDHGAGTISFYDDLFIAKKSRTVAVANLIRERGLHRKVRFTMSVRANMVTPEIVGILKSMNVVSVGMGLESGCQKTLDYLKGGVTVEQNYRAVKLLTDAGIQANGSFVIGAPDETEAEIMETYKFIQTSGMAFPDVYLLTPLPGTPLWQEAVDKKLINPGLFNWSRLAFTPQVRDDQIFMSERVSCKRMKQLKKKFQRQHWLKIAKALPRSPWLRDVPERLWRMVNG